MLIFRACSGEKAAVLWQRRCSSDVVKIVRTFCAKSSAASQTQTRLPSLLVRQWGVPSLFPQPASSPVASPLPCSSILLLSMDLISPSREPSDTNYQRACSEAIKHCCHYAHRYFLASLLTAQNLQGCILLSHLFEASVRRYDDKDPGLRTLLRAKRCFRPLPETKQRYRR